MEIQSKSKELITLELTIAAYEKARPANADHTPEGEGKSIANLYNAIYETLNIQY